eukprot:10200392-Alexandrium_andersonii.AAC.1
MQPTAQHAIAEDVQAPAQLGAPAASSSDAQGAQVLEPLDPLAAAPHLRELFRAMTPEEQRANTCPLSAGSDMD